MSLTARVFRNSGFLLGGQVTDRILRIVVIALLARYLGESDFGLYAFVFAYVEFFNLLTDLGLHTILVREVSRSPERAEEYLGGALSLKLLASLVGTGLALLVVRAMGYPTSTLVLVGWACLGLFLSFRMSSLRQIYDVTFQTKLEMKTPVLLGILSEVLSALFVIGAIALEMSLASIVFLQNLAYLPGALSVAWLARRRIRHPLRWAPGLWKGLLRESLPLALANLFTLAYVKIDILMLSLMRGNADVGFYAAAFKLTGSLSIFPTALLISLFPLMSQYARSSPEALASLFQRSLKAILLVSLPLTVGGMVLAPDLIGLTYGRGYQPSIPALQILIWAVSFSFLSYLFTSALNAMDRQRLYLGLTAAMTFLNIGLNALLIPRHGFIGAAAATVVTEVALTGLCVWVLAGHLRGLDLRSILKFALGAAVMGIVIYFAPFPFALKLLLGAALYLAWVLLFRGVSREEWEVYRSALRPGTRAAE